MRGLPKGVWTRIHLGSTPGPCDASVTRRWTCWSTGWPGSATSRWCAAARRPSWPAGSAGPLQPARSASRTFWEQLSTDVLPFISRNDHPGFLAYVPGCGTWPGVLGDLIASACNLEVSSWVQAAGPSQVELVVLDWFKQWIGFQQEAAGVLVSGGSAANLPALACAREALLLAALCRERGVWLHVDAAYGGFAALTERGQRCGAQPPTRPVTPPAETREGSRTRSGLGHPRTWRRPDPRATRRAGPPWPAVEPELPRLLAEGGDQLVLAHR